MFKIIPADARGKWQKINGRLIENPETIDFSDTPSEGLPNGVPRTGLNVDGVLTGSDQSLEFDGVDDYFILPTINGLGTEILLEGIGKNAVTHGSTSNNIAFESWIKVESATTATDRNSEVFEVTIQRNSISSTTGYDGVYTVRTINALSAFDSDVTTQQYGPGAVPLSAYYLDFLFATASNFAYSVSSTCNVPFDEWVHVWCEHSVTGGLGDPFFKPSPRHTFKLYMNGELNRYQTGDDCMEKANDLDPFPSTTLPLNFFGDRQISFDGQLDEMRIWLNSGTTDSIAELAKPENIGIIPEDFSSQPFSSEVKLQFAPSAEYCVAWWRFETLSAADLFANVADSIVDTSEYNHNGTPIGFVGSVDFSEEETIVQGQTISGGWLSSVSGGLFDHGGLTVIHDNQEELISEEGVQNLVGSGNSLWVASGDSSIVSIDKLNIFYGASAHVINTNQAGEGAIHNIDYSNLLYDRNDYTLSMRMLLTTGSASARVTYTLGHAANSAATTAVFNNVTWKPLVMTLPVSADVNESSITGSVGIQQLHNSAEPDNGSLFRVDGLQLQEGDYYSVFVGPDQIRKGSQLSWNVVD